jgi:hypothetical protein
MKKTLITFIVLGILVGAMVATVPSPKKHRELLKEKCHEEIDKEPGGRVARWLNKKAMDIAVEQMAIQNCFVFSLSYLDGESREYTSLAMFNHVFLLPGNMSDK